MHTEGHIYMITFTFFCKFWVKSFRVCIYILCKWRQKEDIAETAVHFVLKWGFELQIEVNPVSDNSRMLETEDLGDISSAYMPLKQGLSLK